MSALDPQSLVEQASRRGTTCRQALQLFDSLPAVALEDLPGRWIGAGLHTGHPFDGLLEAYGWYGKAFDPNADAHPLLFRQGAGIISVDPRWIPIATLGGSRIARSSLARTGFRLLRPVIRARTPQARLKLVTYRGVASAAMIYNRQPIIDLFRRAGPDMLLGLMDMHGQPPFFFTLRRAG